MEKETVIIEEGHKFGKRTFLGLAKYIDGFLHIKCQCECGQIDWVRYYKIKSGRCNACRSCSRNKGPHSKPSSVSYNDPTYLVWVQIKARCKGGMNPMARSYTLKGIKLCERWKNYNNFLADVGPKPPGHWLVRLNSYKNYEPGNCRWKNPCIKKGIAADGTRIS